MKHYVYLAGPITGLTYDGAQDWREKFASKVNSDKIECLTPLRGKAYLKDAGVLHSGTYDGALTTGKGITRRDFFDCTRASVVLVNLKDAAKVSIGTVMEIAWAFQKQIPVVLVMEPGNVHTHIMIEEAATYTVKNLEEAEKVLKYLLNDQKHEGPGYPV